MALSLEQIYSVAREAGFPREAAVKMVAIAMKESQGNPMAHNPKPPDDSYGLWQINMLGALGPSRRQQLGIASNEALYDPAVNARMAYILWAGNDANLIRHWAINLPGYNATTYNRYLPLAQAAADSVDGVSSSGGGPTPPAPAGGGDGSAVDGEILPADVDPGIDYGATPVELGAPGGLPFPVLLGLGFLGVFVAASVLGDIFD